jgi:hypothetical protein
MANKLTVFADDVYSLIRSAMDSIAGNDRDSQHDYQLFESLVVDMNKRINGEIFCESTLKQHYYAKSKKAVEERKPKTLFKFSSNYMNMLSQIVWGIDYYKKYPKPTENAPSIFDQIQRNTKEQCDTEGNALFKESLQELGIVGVTTKLTESEFEPMNCMAETKRHLYFMGILGSKWVEDKEIFREFLRTIESKNGLVKFLLINPIGATFKRLKTMRGGALSDNSSQIFFELEKEFQCLEVRFYDEIPCFRLIFIDNDKLALTRFKLDYKGYFQSERGWDAPHLIIESKSFWSLYDPFIRYYDLRWGQAQPIDQVIKSQRRSTNGKSKNRSNTR